MEIRTHRRSLRRALPTLFAGAAAILVSAAAFAAPVGQLAVVSPSNAAPVAAPAVPAPAPQAANAALEAVGTGDMLHITVFRNPDLTTDARVTEQGTITFPLVGDVPVIGQLFRYDNRKRSKTNLLIFLKPTVVRTGSTAAALTGERYDYLIREQERLHPTERFFWKDPTVPELPALPPAPLEPAPANAPLQPAPANPPGAATPAR